MLNYYRNLMVADAIPLSKRCCGNTVRKGIQPRKCGFVLRQLAPNARQKFKRTVVRRRDLSLPT